MRATQTERVLLIGWFVIEYITLHFFILDKLLFILSYYYYYYYNQK